MTVGQLLRDMTVAEYVGWLRFYGQKNRQRGQGGQQGGEPVLPTVENTPESIKRAFG